MATTYYVRPDGDNSNTGTGTGTDEAWATFGKAWTAADTAGDVVWVAPGYYEETLGIKDHGTSANPVQYVGDPTGTVFSVSPGNVRVKEFASITAGIKYCRYIVLKNILIGEFVYGDNTTNYANSWWIKAINIAMYNTINGFYRRGSSSASASTAYLYCYNCSFSSVAISYAANGNYKFNAYFYNCAAETSIDFATGSGGSLTRDYCIAPTVGGTNSIAADPDFSDTANYDFTLNPGSQAIDSGYDFGESDDPDVYGFTRIYNGTIDRGASESTQLGTVTWVYPATDGAAFFIDNPWVVFTAPTPAVGTPSMHFKVGCYSDSAATDVLTYWESTVNPEYFKVWDGSAWIDFPAGGIGSAYYGNSVACYMSLSRRDTYYFRAWVGAVS